MYLYRTWTSKNVINAFLDVTLRSQLNLVSRNLSSNLVHLSENGLLLGHLLFSTDCIFLNLNLLFRSQVMDGGMLILLESVHTKWSTGVILWTKLCLNNLTNFR